MVKLTPDFYIWKWQLEWNGLNDRTDELTRKSRFQIDSNLFTGDDESFNQSPIQSSFFLLTSYCVPHFSLSLSHTHTHTHFHSLSLLRTHTNKPISLLPSAAVLARILNKEEFIQIVSEREERDEIPIEANQSFGWGVLCACSILQRAI